MQCIYFTISAAVICVLALYRPLSSDGLHNCMYIHIGGILLSGSSFVSYDICLYEYLIVHTMVYSYLDDKNGMSVAIWSEQTSYLDDNGMVVAIWSEQTQG